MGMLHNRQAGGKITMNEHLEQMWDWFGANIHLWVRVFGRQLPKVADDLTLHIIFKWSEPGHGLIIHRVMQFQELCQLPSFNLNTKMHIMAEWKTVDFFSLSFIHIHNTTFGFGLSCTRTMQKYFYTFLSSKYSILAVWYPSLCPWLSTLKRAMPMVSTTERPSGKNLTSLTSSIQPWSANL